MKYLRQLFALLAILTVLTPFPAQAALATSLVAYWKFDESSGTATDASGNSNTLTNNNTVTFGAAVINNGSVYAHASSQSFSITDASQTGLDFSGDFSFSTWVNFTTKRVEGSPLIFKRVGTGNQRSYSWELNGSGNGIILVTFTDGSSVGCNVTVSWTPSLTTWYYATVTKSGTTVKFYVNGSQQGTDQTCGSATVFNSTGAVNVGGWVFDGSEFLDGKLDEMGMWSRALTGTEITSLYNAGAGCAHPFSACEAGPTPPNVGTFYLSDQ